MVGQGGCQSLTEKVTFGHKLKEAKEGATYLTGARTSRCGGIASAKALGQESGHV